MLVEPTLERVAYIANRLRPLDHVEIFAQRWTDDPNQMAEDYLNIGSPAWLFLDNVTREPIYFCGLSAERPGVWGLFGFGTPLFPRVVGEVTRLLRRVVVPTGPQLGHRFEAACLAEKEAAIRWLIMLGAKYEADLKGYGRNREDFKLLAWRF